MRIDYIINSMEGGGAQTPLPRIVRALEKAGATVRVLALTRRNGLAIERLRAAGIELVVRDGGERDHFAAIRWIERQARSGETQLLWTSLTRATLLGQIAGDRLGLPVVSWQHNAFLKPWNERLLRWRAGKSVMWVADSAEVARLTGERMRIAAGHLETWPIFAADAGSAQVDPWLTGQPIVIGSLGRLHPAKGYDLLIDAVALLKSRAGLHLPPFRIVIGGTGTDEAALRSRARAAGVQEMEFAGYVQDTAAFFATLHLYVQPSRREGFCVAAHEALQAGLPVIVSATGEMPFTVDATIGRVVPVGDAEALADALTGLLMQPHLLALLGGRGRERVLSKFCQNRFDAAAQRMMDRLRAPALLSCYPVEAASQRQPAVFNLVTALSPPPDSLNAQATQQDIGSHGDLHPTEELPHHRQDPRTCRADREQGQDVQDLPL